MQLDGADYETGSVDALARGEELLDEFHLTFLQALDTKGHST